MEKRFLIDRWFGSLSPIPIYDEASVSSARLRVREAGRQLGIGAQIVESAALIASELTHNQLAHARQGYFAVATVQRDGVKGIEMHAADIGPGMERPAQAIEDGSPTGTGLHAGLGAVCRMADEVEFDNRIFEGLCVIARKFEPGVTPLSYDRAIMGRPFPGEIISGDDGAFYESESGLVAAVSDGLGHGPEARDASKSAIQALEGKREIALDVAVQELNGELAQTRGCAMSIVRFDKSSRMLECVSIGDVHVHLYKLRDAHFFTATPFILGGKQFQKPKVRVETVPVEAGSVLVIFTDGLKSRTSLKGQLDVLRRPPIAIAEHLLENHSRPDDDALVLVARFRG